MEHLNKKRPREKNCNEGEHVEGEFKPKKAKVLDSSKINKIDNQECFKTIGDFLAKLEEMNGGVFGNRELNSVEMIDDLIHTVQNRIVPWTEEIDQKMVKDFVDKLEILQRWSFENEKEKNIFEDEKGNNIGEMCKNIDSKASYLESILKYDIPRTIDGTVPNIVSIQDKWECIREKLENTIEVLIEKEAKESKKPELEKRSGGVFGNRELSSVEMIDDLIHAAQNRIVSSTEEIDQKMVKDFVDKLEILQRWSFENEKEKNIFEDEKGNNIYEVCNNIDNKASYLESILKYDIPRTIDGTVPDIVSIQDKWECIREKLENTIEVLIEKEAKESKKPELEKNNGGIFGNKEINSVKMIDNLIRTVQARMIPWAEEIDQKMVKDFVGKLEILQMYLEYESINNIDKMYKKIDDGKVPYIGSILDEQKEVSQYDVSWNIDNTVPDIVNIQDKWEYIKEKVKNTVKVLTEKDTKERGNRELKEKGVLDNSIESKSEKELREIYIEYLGKGERISDVIRVLKHRAKVMSGRIEQEQKSDEHGQRQEQRSEHERALKQIESSIKNKEEIANLMKQDLEKLSKRLSKSLSKRSYSDHNNSEGYLDIFARVRNFKLYQEAYGILKEETVRNAIKHGDDIFNQVGRLCRFYEPTDASSTSEQTLHNRDMGKEIGNDKEALMTLLDLNQHINVNGNDIGEKVGVKVEELLDKITGPVDINGSICKLEDIESSAKKLPCEKFIWQNKQKLQTLAKSNPLVWEFLLLYGAHLLQRQKVSDYLQKIRNRRDEDSLGNDEKVSILSEFPPPLVDLQLFKDEIVDKFSQIEGLVKGQNVNEITIRAEMYCNNDEHGDDTCSSQPDGHAVFDGTSNGLGTSIFASLKARQVFEREMSNFTEEVKKNAKEKGVSIVKCAAAKMREIAKKADEEIKKGAKYLAKTFDRNFLTRDGNFRDGYEPKTTMTALTIVENENKEKVAVILNVADSRCYRINEALEIEQLTLDNATLYDLRDTEKTERLWKRQKLLATPADFRNETLEKHIDGFKECLELTAEEKADNAEVLRKARGLISQRNKVSSVLGRPEELKGPAVYAYKVKPGNMFILTTDGVHDPLPDELILQSQTKVIKHPKDEGEIIVLNKFQFSPERGNQAAQAIVDTAVKFADTSDPNEDDELPRRKQDDASAVVVFIA